MLCFNTPLRSICQMSKPSLSTTHSHPPTQSPKNAEMSRKTFKPKNDIQHTGDPGEPSRPRSPGAPVLPAGPGEPGAPTGPASPLSPDLPSIPRDPGRPGIPYSTNQIYLNGQSSFFQQNSDNCFEI